MGALRGFQGTYSGVSLLDNETLTSPGEPMQQVVIPRVHCYRCYHTWTPVKAPVRMCPRCKSLLWDVPKIRPIKLGNGLGIDELVKPHLTQIRRLARRYGVDRLSVFGSVRRKEATNASDVDILVRWKRPVTLLDKMGLGLELEKILGRPVDLANEGGLHWGIRPQVMAEAVPL